MNGTVSAVPSRPLLRWHGGKWMLAPWIIAHFPPHRVYVEPFGGAASVLLRKPRAYAEIYNDLDDDVVGLFRVLRSRRACELIEALRLTPYARSEFDLAYAETDCPVERARRLIARSFMGFGAGGATGHSTSFRANGNGTGGGWRNYPEALKAIVERLLGVVIEHRPAIDVCRQHDGPETLLYLDPPYLPETRSYCVKLRYRHEMSDGDHAAFLQEIVSLRSMVVLSGYPSPLYDDALAGWRRVERPALADGARKRTEVLWINPAASRRLADPSPQLMDFAVTDRTEAGASPARRAYRVSSELPAAPCEWHGPAQRAHLEGAL